MTIFVFLLLCYGICFFVQHKMPFLHGKHELLTKLLICTYCLGFHCGWISYLLMVWGKAFEEISLPNLLIYSFVSASFCYICDATVQYLENNSLKG
tara:strand:- start:2253 stop:2540 length:288 start_codon:yes stop_codon:yes gene_type:complete